MNVFQHIPPQHIKWIFIILFLVLSLIYLFISTKERYTDESLIDQICKQTNFQLDCNKPEDLTKAVEICKLQRASYSGCQSTDPEVLAQACPIQCDSSLSTFSKEDTSMYEGYKSEDKPTIVTNTLNLNENAVLQSANPFQQDTYASNPVISIRKSNRGI